MNLCEGEQAVPERRHPAPDRDGAGDVRALLGRGGVREPGTQFSRRFRDMSEVVVPSTAVVPKP